MSKLPLSETEADKRIAELEAEIAELREIVIYLDTSDVLETDKLRKWAARILIRSRGLSPLNTL